MLLHCFLPSFFSRERNIHADVTPLSFLPSFFPKKASIKHAQRGVRDDPLSLPSFLSRERKRARRSAFFAKLSFL